VFLLNKLLYKPINKILKIREDRINSGLQTAEKNIQDKNELEKKIKSDLAKTRKETSKLIKDAKDEASQKAKVIISETKANMKDESLKQSKKLEQEYIQKEKLLNKKIGKLVVETTTKVLSDVLTPKDIKSITNATIKKLG